jgi:hypothetical protein
VPKVYHQLTFLSGEEAQVDWCFIRHPQLGRLYGFVYILSYSRYLFAHIFPRSSFEFFIEGHLMAFSARGGIPYGIRYDNLASVVLKRGPEVQYNPRFLEFSRHYNLEIRLCNPGAGNEKGRVERAIRTLQETFFNTMDKYASLRRNGRHIGLHSAIRDGHFRCRHCPPLLHHPLHTSPSRFRGPPIPQQRRRPHRKRVAVSFDRLAKRRWERRWASIARLPQHLFSAHIYQACHCEHLPKR